MSRNNTARNIWRKALINIMGKVGSSLSPTLPNSNRNLGRIGLATGKVTIPWSSPGTHVNLIPENNLDGDGLVTDWNSITVSLATSGRKWEVQHVRNLTGYVEALITASEQPNLKKVTLDFQCYRSTVNYPNTATVVPFVIIVPDGTAAISPTEVTNVGFEGAARAAWGGISCKIIPFPEMALDMNVVRNLNGTYYYAAVHKADVTPLCEGILRRSLAEMAEGETTYPDVHLCFAVRAPDDSSSTICCHRITLTYQSERRTIPL